MIHETQKFRRDTSLARFASLCVPKSRPVLLQILMAASSPSDHIHGQQALEKAGLNPIFQLVSDPAQFSEALAVQPFDLVLAAERLSGWSGLHALKLLQEQQKDIPFILLTAAPLSESALKVLQEAGADVARQDDLAGLCLTVERALERKTLREQRSNLEIQLHQSQKMETIGRLAAGAAHDFNNILTVIQGHVGLLRVQPNLSPEVTQSLQHVSQATERASKLIAQMAAFSREHAADLQPLDLNEVLAHLSTLLNRSLGEDIAVQLSCAPDLPPVLADRSLLEQAVLDLALNARDAMPAGGQLVISTASVQIDAAYAEAHPEARAGLCVCLSIIDTGGGLQPAVLARMLDPSARPGEPPQAIDLRLATVQGIVHRHHGWLEVQSRAGQGSTFRLFLPAGVETRRGDKRHARAIPRGAETILIVEDEPPVLWITRNILEHHGYRVLEANSGVEALAIWHQHQNEIALLLTDIVMPVGVTGQELAEQFHRQKPSLKVIYTSGYTAQAAAAKGLELIEGVNFLKKPYDAERLALTVRRLLDHSAPTTPPDTPATGPGNTASRAPGPCSAVSRPDKSR